MAKTRKLALTQGANDAFIAGSIRIGGRRLVLIHKAIFKISLAGAWADTHQIQLALTNALKGAMPSPNDNTVQYYREATQVGAPASLIDLQYEVSGLPGFIVDDSIHFQFDSANTGGANTVYITIYYDEKKII